jgi:hypothetical protein
MRRSTMWVMAAALAAFPAAASAQVSLGLGGGPSTPMGDFGDEAGTGFHAQASLSIGVPLLPLGGRGDLMFQQFPDEHSGNFRQVGGLANATLGLPLPLIVISPYAIGGVGVFHHTSPEEDHGDHSHDGESGTAGAWNVGAGLRLGLPGLSASLEARYLDAGNGVRSVPVTVGIRF